jgi:MFS family permease
MFLASFSTSYFSLLWITALSGIGRSTYHPLAVSILSRIFGRDTLGRAMGLHLSGSGMGMVLAPLLVGVLLTRFSWRLPLQVWSGLVFFLQHSQQAVNPQRRSLHWPFISRPLIIYLIGSSVWGLAQGGVMAFAALFLVDQRNFQPETAAATYGLMSLAGLICRPFLGALMDRMGRRKPVIIAGYIISAFSILGLVLITRQWLLYGPLILLGIFGTGHSGLADTFMIESIPSKRREETLGFVYTFRMGISSFSPLLIGLLSEWITIQSAFLALSAMAVAAALVFSRAEENPQE